MKWLLFLITSLLVIACKVTKNGKPIVSETYPIDLEIKLLVNGNSFSYEFRFLNTSVDTIYIVKPELNQGYSYFFKLNSDTTISNKRCVNYAISKIEWIQLIPKRECTIFGRKNLKDLFCDIHEADLIGYNYHGAYRRKNNVDNNFNFEILPVTIVKLDSILIKKKLFR